MTARQARVLGARRDFTPLLNGILDSADPVARMAGAAVANAGEVIGPEAVAALTVDAVRDGRFLVLPHPAVLEMYRHKGADYERWLAGMRRYQGTLSGTPVRRSREGDA